MSDSDSDSVPTEVIDESFDDKNKLLSDESSEDEEETEIEGMDNVVLEEEENSTITEIYRIPDNMRRTRATLTMGECTKVIGTRATHINKGGPVYTDITNLTSTENMALKELYDGRCPLILRRFLNNTTYERWSIRDMNLPHGFKKNNIV